MKELIIKNGIIHTVTQPEPVKGDIRIGEGKIVCIKSSIPVRGKETFDAAGMHIYPGFIDAHTHMGLHGYGGSPLSSDINEISDPVMPHLRAIDAVNPQDTSFAVTACAGVTTVATGPGSANVINGTFTVLKTAGKCVDDMIILKEAAMKCALGEGPKMNYAHKLGNRMHVAALLRETLIKATRYRDRLAKDPEAPFDMKLEAMLPVVRGQIPLKIHAHQTNDIFTAIRIAREFGLKITIDHCTEGHLIAEELAAAGYGIITGPGMTFPGKFELRHKTFETPGILQRAGCLVTISTDSGAPQYLTVCAGLAVREGMDEYEALKAITINPAIILGVQDRVGSLELGKDADLVIADGNPLQTTTRIIKTLINGEFIK